MTDQEPTTDLLGKADALIAKVDQLTGYMAESNVAFLAWHKDLSDYAHRSRTLVKVLFGTIVIGILLMAAVGWVVLWNRERLHDIERIAVNSCEDGNELRQRNVVLWEEVLRLNGETSGADKTPEELKRIQDFQVFVQTTFASRNCSLGAQG